MFNPNMLALARVAQMNTLLNQVRQTQTFLNQAVPNQPVQNVQLQMSGTCEEQLANGMRIFDGLFQTLRRLPPLLGECRDFVGRRSAEPGASDVMNAVDNASLAVLRLLSAAEVLGSTVSLTLGPSASCEDALAMTQTLVRGLVNLFDQLILPALSLCSFFLMPRTEEAGAEDLLDRDRVLISQVTQTILAAARAFLPPTF